MQRLTRPTYSLRGVTPGPGDTAVSNLHTSSWKRPEFCVDDVFIFCEVSFVLKTCFLWSAGHTVGHWISLKVLTWASCKQMCLLQQASRLLIRETALKKRKGSWKWTESTWDHCYGRSDSTMKSKLPDQTLQCKNPVIVPQHLNTAWRRVGGNRGGKWKPTS